MKTVFLFPGQGSQYIGMGKEIYQKFDFAKKIFNQACDILDYDIKEICFNDENNLLNQTKFTQPSIFIYSVILDYLLKDNNIYPNAVAGHSLGEITALTSINSLNFEDALVLINKRSESMYINGKRFPGKMIAVIDNNRDLIQSLIKEQNGILCIANYNSPKQIIISGESDSINNIIDKLKSNGIRKVLELNVSGAFHSPMMEKTKIYLNQFIQSINFNNIDTPIYQNFSPKKNLDPNIIKQNLINQIDNPVRWEEIILNLCNDNFKYFIEVGPSNVLTKLNKDMIPKLKFINIESMGEYLNI